MKVTIDPDAGFCFGVNQAIRQADQLLDAGKPVYCLGDIVHNAAELSRLKIKGLKIINYDEFRTLSDETVIIRAHGEPPSTYDYARLNNVKLIDATCPIVHKLQQRIGKHFREGLKGDTQIVIFGKEGHAEVSGLKGQTDESAIVISNEADLNKIDFKKKVSVFSQTTMDQEAYGILCREIEHRMKLANHDGIPELKVFNTICRQVSNRAPLLEVFAGSKDVIVFVSGNNSSNGKYLFSKCKSVNKLSYLISNADEIQKVWFTGAEKVGVSGATSTPLSQLTEVADKIAEICQ